MARSGGSRGTGTRRLQPGVRPAIRRRRPGRDHELRQHGRARRCGSARAATSRWWTCSSRRGTRRTPTCKINLTYIPHTEMVGKIAQGIASGDVPDLMGMDLIYAPQFEKAQQLVDITDRIKDWPELDDRQQGPHDRRDLRGPALRRSALRRRLGAVLQQGPVHAGPGSTRTSRRPAWPSCARTPTRSRALGGDIKGYYLPGNCAGCNIFTVGPLMWASGAKIEAAAAGDEPLDRRRRQAGAPVRPRHGQGRQRARGRPDRERRDVPPAVRLRQGRHDGHRQLQHHARPPAEPDDELRHRPAARRRRRARRPRSSAATSSSCRRAASGSTTRSTS